MRISYGIGKYILVLGLMLMGYGFYSLSGSEDTASDIGPIFTTMIGLFASIAGLLFIFIARGHKKSVSNSKVSNKDEQSSN